LNQAASIVDINAVRDYAPGVHAALSHLASQAFAAIDPQTWELVRLRVAMLTRNPRELARRWPDIALSEEKIAALPQWPKSPLYSAAERACLEFTEQYVIDVAGMTDDMVNNLLKHYDSSAIFALVHAIYAIDGAQRTQLVLDRLLND
jgi:alkylhydroperoxidase family enzyme